MSNLSEWTHIKQAYLAGNQRPFTVIFRKLKPKILRFLRQKIPSVSTDLIEDAYTDAVLNFSYKYLHGEQVFPKNVEAYIKIAAHHKAIDLWRKTQNKSAIKLEELDVQKVANALHTMLSTHAAKDDFYYEAEQTEHQTLLTLQNAIAQLCERCRVLIEENLFARKTLRQLRAELDYKTYQSIVDKKHRCLKKLRKLFYQELIITE